MRLATLEGVMQNGRICLTTDVRLLECAKVYEIVPAVQMTQTNYTASPRLVHSEQAKDFRLEIVVEGISWDELAK